MHVGLRRELHGDGLGQRDDHGKLRDAGCAHRDGDAISGDNYDRAGAVGSRGGGCVAGGATPTGSIVLTSGSYTSAATTLSNGSATINIPAGTLPAGTDSLKATYTPDSASSTAYATSSGTGSVTVNASRRTDRDGDAVSHDDYDRAGALGHGCGGRVAGRRDADRVGRSDERKLHVSGDDAERRFGDDQCSGRTLPVGTDSLKATYTPDSASSTAYLTSSGTGSVTVTLPPPTLSLGLSLSTITTTQPLTVTISASGTPTPTGSVVLTSGTYTSATTTLNAGVAVITVPAGSLAAGTDTLTATYTPDSASSSTYGSGTKTATVTVAYAITVASVEPGKRSEYHRQPQGREWEWKRIDTALARVCAAQHNRYADCSRNLGERQHLHARGQDAVRPPERRRSPAR